MTTRDEDSVTERAKNLKQQKFWSKTYIYEIFDERRYVQMIEFKLAILQYVHQWAFGAKLSNYTDRVRAQDDAWKKSDENTCKSNLPWRGGGSF